MPSHQSCSHSPIPRRYSEGCTTSGVGICTERLEATERTETSGCSALIVCNESRGMVGTSSACTESAVTICVDASILDLAAPASGTEPLSYVLYGVLCVLSPAGSVALLALKRMPSA